jgi:hypothetical protein
MLLVPLDANFALKIRSPPTNIEKVRANHVLLVERPKMAAPDVPIAHRVHLKMVLWGLKCAPNAPLGLHKVTPIKHLVLGVSGEKKHQQLLPLLVRNVIWANSI